MSVLNNAYVSIATVDLSAYVQSLELTYEAETVDDTAMGDVFRSTAASLKKWNVKIVFHQSIANVDANIFAAVGTTVALEFRATTSAVGAGNPKFTGTGLITSYQPFSQSVGDQHTVPITIVAASDLTRATS